MTNLLEWQLIGEQSDGTTEYRARVSGGWLVKIVTNVATDMTEQQRGRFETGYEWRNSVCFVPDPHDAWGTKYPFTVTEHPGSKFVSVNFEKSQAHPKSDFWIEQGQGTVTLCSKSERFLLPVAIKMKEHTLNDLVAHLNAAHRPNVESREDGFYVCWNDHHRSQDCEWEKVIEYI